MIQYTTVDRILAKLSREIKNLDISEDDLIEMIGEAMDFMRMYNTSEQAVVFIRVKDHIAKLPKGLQSILQVAMYSGTLDPIKEPDAVCGEIIEEITEEATENRPEKRCCVIDECGTRVQIIETPPHWQWLFTKYDFPHWATHDYYKSSWTPIRLSNHTFFNSIVCQEKDMSIYKSCKEEYTIAIGLEPVIKTSFKDGMIAISYLSTLLDPDTGYPLILDDIRVITAISYYVKWKIAERNAWNNERGFITHAERAEARWLKYVKQAKNYIKMPKTIDEYQSLLEETHNIIPNINKYYGYFGTVGQSIKANI